MNANAIAQQVFNLASSAENAESIARLVNSLLHIERRYDCNIVRFVFADRSLLVFRGDSYIAVNANDADSIAAYADWLGDDVELEQGMIDSMNRELVASYRSYGRVSEFGRLLAA